jgi:hypothetical protein
MTTRPPCRGPLAVAVLITVGALAGCQSEPSTGPEAVRISAARGAGGGGASPTVTSTSPSEAPQGITLDVQVFGTGYSTGAAVSMLLDGKSTTKIKTNSTRFVTSTELVANITIAFDAVPELYDVQVVTTNGKKGIGIELFAVTGQLVDLIDRPSGTAPAGLFQDGSGLYDRGTMSDGSNGTGNFNIQPECARFRSMDLVVPGAWTALLPPVAQRSDCDDPSGGSGRRIQLHFPGIASADCPDGSTCPIGGPHAAGSSNYAPDVFYFFHVDRNGDGKFGPPKDDAYNVVWSDAVFGVLQRAPDLTPCQWHVVGATARLWKRPSVALDTDRAVVLDAIVTRTDGVCS